MTNPAGRPVVMYLKMDTIKKSNKIKHWEKKERRKKKIKILP